MEKEFIISKPEFHQDVFHGPITIPEPSVIALCIVGAALFLLIRWRKQFNPRNVPIRFNDLLK